MRRITCFAAFLIFFTALAHSQTPTNTYPYPSDGGLAIGATSMAGSEKLRVNGNVHVDGSLSFPNNLSYLSLGNNSQYPYGMTTIGNGSGNGGIFYHYQINDGPAMKVDVDGYNFAPAVHVTGAGAYLNGGLMNVSYTHLNSVYVTAAYKATMGMNSTQPGGSVVGFQTETSTIAGTAVGGNFLATSTGTGSAFGLYVNAYLGAGATGNAWGVYIDGGKNYFKDNVAIGTTDSKGYKLAVNGDAIFTKIKVRPYGQWADYVFANTYKLPTLKKVEAFIKAHKHLPDVPSTAQVEKEGLDVGENQAVLLKKIEELTLYVIEMGKRLDAQQKEIRALRQDKQIKNHR